MIKRKEDFIIPNFST